MTPPVRGLVRPEWAESLGKGWPSEHVNPPHVTTITLAVRRGDTHRQGGVHPPLGAWWRPSSEAARSSLTRLDRDRLACPPNPTRVTATLARPCPGSRG